MLVLSSLIAGTATSPIAAAHFNRSAQYCLIADLLVVPVMGAVVMPAGVIAALLAPPGIAGLVSATLLTILHTLGGTPEIAKTIAVPLIVGALRRADAMGDALAARGLDD